MNPHPVLSLVSLAAAAAAAAALTAAPVPLQFGMPTTQLSVPGLSTTVYAVEVPASPSDVTFSLALVYGISATLLVAPQGSYADPPACAGPNASSFSCTGAVWRATAVTASPGVALQLLPDAPCAPALIHAMPPPVVASADCGKLPVGSGGGSYFVSVFANVDDPLGIGFTLLVTTTATAADGPGAVWMEFGQPYVLVSSNASVTNNGLGLPPGAFASFAIDNAVTPQQVLRVDRWCGGSMMMPDCGPPLAVFLTVCVLGVCNGTALFPSYFTSHTAAFAIGTGTDGAYYTLPQGPCAVGSHAPSCATFIGVFPDCGDPPGYGDPCGAPVAAVLSFTRTRAPSLLPSACFSGGTGMISCVTRTGGSVAQFAAYLGDMSAPPSMGGMDDDMVMDDDDMSNSVGGGRGDGTPLRLRRDGGATEAAADGAPGPPLSSNGPPHKGPPPMMSMSMGPMPGPGDGSSSAAPFLLTVTACSSDVNVKVAYPSYSWSASSDPSADPTTPLVWPRLPLFPRGIGADDAGTTRGAPGATYTLSRNGTPSAQLGGWLGVQVASVSPSVDASWETMIAVGASPVLSPPLPLSSAPRVTRSPVVLRVSASSSPSANGGGSGDGVDSSRGAAATAVAAAAKAVLDNASRAAAATAAADHVVTDADSLADATATADEYGDEAAAVVEFADVRGGLVEQQWHQQQQEAAGVADTAALAVGDGSSSDGDFHDTSSALAVGDVGGPWLAVMWDAVLMSPLDGSSDPVPDPPGAMYYVYALPSPLPVQCRAQAAVFNLDTACGMRAYAAAVAGMSCAPLIGVLMVPMNMQQQQQESASRSSSAAHPTRITPSDTPPFVRMWNFTNGIDASLDYTVYLTADCSFGTMACLMMPGGGTLTAAYVPVTVTAGGITRPSGTPYSTPTISATPSLLPLPPTPPDWAPDAFMWLGIAVGGLGCISLLVWGARRRATARGNDDDDDDDGYVAGAVPRDADGENCCGPDEYDEEGGVGGGGGGTWAVMPPQSSAAVPTSSLFGSPAPPHQRAGGRRADTTSSELGRALLERSTEETVADVAPLSVPHPHPQQQQQRR